MISIWYNKIKNRKFIQIIIPYSILLIFIIGFQIVFYFLNPFINLDLFYYIGLSLFFILNLILNISSSKISGKTIISTQKLGISIIEISINILLYGFFKIWFIAIFSTLVSLNMIIIGKIFFINREQRIIFENKFDTSSVKPIENNVSKEKSFNHIAFGMIPISSFIIVYVLIINRTGFWDVILILNIIYLFLNLVFAFAFIINKRREKEV